MEVEIGTAIWIYFSDGEKHLALTDSMIEIVDALGEKGNSFRVISKQIYFYSINPLTSQLGLGLCHALEADISCIEIVEKIPVESDFDIETIESLARNGIGKQLAVSFFSEFSSWLLHYEPKLIHEINSDSVIRRSDLTAFGLDFMRQNYDAIRRGIVKDLRIPSKRIYDSLAEVTKNNRTNDHDWRLK